MSSHILPDPDALRELLKYDPESPSALRWRHSGRGRRLGLGAGALDPRGYWKVRVGGRLWYAHRIVWALQHGADPGDAQIDHINGDPSDNRLDNLRLATSQQNAWNRRHPPHGASRFRGVYLDRRAMARPWYSQIAVGSETLHVGVFRCETAAALAYDRAARRLRGPFAALNMCVEESFQ